MTRLAGVLSEYRFQRRLSLREFAAQLGVSQASYARFEKGEETYSSTSNSILLWLLGHEAAAGNEGLERKERPANAI